MVTSFLHIFKISFVFTKRKKLKTGLKEWRVSKSWRNLNYHFKYLCLNKMSDFIDFVLFFISFIIVY